ncbi:unnamed protein product [Camellia sinensis]
MMFSQTVWQSSYRVCIGGVVEKLIELSMADINYQIQSDSHLASNRRTAMSKVRTVKGVGWDISAIGNAKLADVLELEKKGGPYKASIPLIRSTNSEADVLLAYEMNGEPLNRDHGYPLRVVVPGVIGARSVKWLDSINIIGEECQGFFMQRDYKKFPPSVNWENIDWSTQKPQMDFPVQHDRCTVFGYVLDLRKDLKLTDFKYLGILNPLLNKKDRPKLKIDKTSLCSSTHGRAICSLEDDNTVQHGKVEVHGYALFGGGRGIERLNVSFDGDKARVEASRHQKSGIPYNAIADDDKYCDKWAWVLLKLKVMSSTIQRFLPKL